MSPGKIRNLRVIREEPFVTGPIEDVIIQGAPSLFQGGDTITTSGLAPITCYPTGLLRGDTAFQLDSIYQWSGWNVTEESGGTALNGTPTVDVGEEIDSGTGGTGNTTTFLRVLPSVEEGGNAAFHLYRAMPDNFNGWGEDGINLYWKCLGWSNPSSGVLDTFTVTIHVYGTDGLIDVSGIRTCTNSLSVAISESSYSPTNVTKAQLNGMANPLESGDLFHLRINISGAFGDATGLGVRLGRLTVDWT